MSNSNFHDFSKSIASKFIQTVVIVDDLASFQSNTSEDKPEVLTPPGRNVSLANASEQTNIQKVVETHSLNVKIIIDKCADFGIVCSALKPEKGEEYSQKTEKLAQRTDILVLDWFINDDSGKTAKEMIKSIAVDVNNNKRLCLVVIYTGQSELLKIADQIQEDIGLDHSTIIRENNVIKLGSLRIVVLAKGGTKVSDPNLAISEDGLVDRLLTEFTAMTAGLVSNVALDAFAEIRQNTYRILQKFSSPIDIPYLIHRGLHKIHSDAEDHIIPLIVSEIEAVLDDTNIKVNVDDKKISQWATEHGIDLASLSSKAETGVLGKHNDSNLDFAIQMSCRSRYTSEPPFLTLGTIIHVTRIGQSPKFMICLQPSCDSVRINGARAFPFLLFEETPNAKGATNVVCYKSVFKTLKLKLKPYECEMITFQPFEGKERISAIPDSTTMGSFTFDATNADIKIDWVAQLKSEHAIRIAVKYGAELSRVGLTESEWFRLLGR